MNDEMRRYYKVWTYNRFSGLCFLIHKWKETKKGKKNKPIKNKHIKVFLFMLIIFPFPLHSENSHFYTIRGK